MLGSMSLHRAVELLYYWQNGGDSFTCQLYSLFSKADPENKTRLQLGFPIEAHAYSLWYAALDPEEFFRVWGVGVKHPVEDDNGTEPPK